MARLLATARGQWRAGLLAAARLHTSPPRLAGPRLEQFLELVAAQERLAPVTPSAVVVEVGGGEQGTVRHVECSAATPLEALKHLKARGEAVPPRVLGAVVNGRPWDLKRPLPAAASTQRLRFLSADAFSTDPAVSQMFWQSAAHVLGAAMQQHLGDDLELCEGSAAPTGFFHEGLSLSGQPLSMEDTKALTQAAEDIIRTRAPFVRAEATPEQALALFANSSSKQGLIHAAAQANPAASLSLYACGAHVDLSPGPHIPHVGLIESLRLTNVTTTQQRADWPSSGDGIPDTAVLHRVVGISFPSKRLAREWTELRDLARERDHRVIGKEQKLYATHSCAPGTPFFLPNGTHIINRLLEFLRGEYKKRGYKEVRTPIVFDKELWEQSGHWDHYQDDMYFLAAGSDAEKRECGLKPMNCPSHCLVYKDLRPSHLDLPLRLADFSALHRNESSGAVTGLTRVRQFHQDDAHIFCTPEQAAEEVAGCLDLVDRVYRAFGFEYSLTLSTRPDSFVGDLDTWDKAEAQLQECLQALGRSWTLSPGDGAFYGPKIDVHVKDALQRMHQTATIQLDFQLPGRFDLKYQDGDGALQQPIIIHRAIFGSVERILAILIESTGGRWPLWLNPRQVAVLPVTSHHEDYARKVAGQLRAAGVEAELDASHETLGRRIRAAHGARVNYVAVVGASEAEHGAITVTPTLEGSGSKATMPVGQFIAQLEAEAMPPE